MHQRVDVLRRLATLIETRRDHFSRLIAQEGGKLLTDAIVETTRAIDGVRNAAEELRNFAGREIPMGLTPASTGRLAFTTKEWSSSLSCARPASTSRGARHSSPRTMRWPSGSQRIGASRS